jgi:hypothetical protein
MGWVGGMYFPWITTMSSGHDVREYELGAGVYHVRKIMIFAKKKMV